MRNIGFYLYLYFYNVCYKLLHKQRIIIVLYSGIVNFHVFLLALTEDSRNAASNTQSYYNEMIEYKLI